MGLKRVLLKYNVEYKCSECGLENLWNNKQLSLQVDHIDGNNKNNDLTNLRFLCPNCHSQTHTFSGRNAKGNVKNEWKNTSDEKWINSINESFSVSESISKLGFNFKNSLIRNHVKTFIDCNKAKLKEKSESMYIQDKIYKLENSNIDFSRFGWVSIASKIIEIEPQKVGQWMMKHMPAFYEDKCYRRKMKGC